MRWGRAAVARLPKAYAVELFCGADGPSVMVGVEKEGPILRYALDGTLLETVAEGPGGVMTLLQMPGREDQLLATASFFSPNHGGDGAQIVCYTRGEDGRWGCTTVCRLPYVHRFGLLRGGDGRTWLLACTIKGACRAVPNDWSVPGAVWAAQVDRPLEEYGDERPLPLAPIAACQLQNHGFWCEPDARWALVATAAGVFRYTPPRRDGGAWAIECLAVGAASDACMVDLDGDGIDELVTIAPFHGGELSVWKDSDGCFARVWSSDSTAHPFLHALWGGSMGERQVALVGARGGERALMAVSHGARGYGIEVIDTGGGAANCMAVTDSSGRVRVVSANREADEVVWYGRMEEDA